MRPQKQLIKNPVWWNPFSNPLTHTHSFRNRFGSCFFFSFLLFVPLSDSLAPSAHVSRSHAASFRLHLGALSKCSLWRVGVRRGVGREGVGGWIKTHLQKSRLAFQQEINRATALMYAPADTKGRQTEAGHN